MIRLQERDSLILRHCCEQQFLRVEEVARFVYKGIHKSEAYRRLKELVRAGYLREVRPIRGTDLRIYRVSRLGYAEAMRVSPFIVAPSRRLNVANLHHDSLVTAVRMRLRELWDACWTPEAVLRQSHGRDPHPNTAIGDGLIEFASGMKIAIEVETTLKSMERYREIFRNWGRNKYQPLFVLYVAGTETIAKKLQEHFHKIAPVEMRFGVIDVDSLMRSPPPAMWTIRGDIPIFIRKDF